MAMKMLVVRRKRDYAPDHVSPEQPLDPSWSQVALKPHLGQAGIPLPGSVQHPLWIQPRLRRFT